MNKTLIHTIFLIVFVLSMTSCCLNLCKNDDLKIQRIDYTGNQLRIDGYYFGDSNPDSSMPFAKIYYLYRNGIFYTSEVSDLTEAQDGTISVDVENNFGKKAKGSWGVFRVNNNFIEIERWYYTSYGCENTIYENGDILNDTIFIVNYREYRRNGKVKYTDAPNSMFKFRPLTQKPDSTNSFVK